MPINELIARGVVPIGEGVPNTLYHIAALREARARDAEFARRTSLYEQNAEFERGRLTRQDEITEEDRTEAQKLKRLREMLPAIEAGDPNVIAEAISGIERVNPALADAMRKDKTQLIKTIKKMIGEPGAPEFGRTPGGGEYATQDGKLAGQPHYPTEHAPRREEWVEVEDEKGQRWVYDANALDPRTTLRPLTTPDGRHLGSPPSRAERPQVTNDAFGDTWEIVPTEGGLVRRPVPTIDQSGPTVVRSKAIAEAKAAVATGRISKEEAAGRLRDAGIVVDPSELAAR